MLGTFIGRSIERQLIVRIAVIFVVALTAIFSGLVYRVFSALEELSEIALQTQARAIAERLTIAADGSVQVALPDTLQKEYSVGSATHFYAVLTPSRQMAASSDAARAAAMIEYLPTTLGAGRFFFTAEAGAEVDYLGYLQPAGTYWIAVAQRRDVEDEGLVASVLEEYIEVIGWWVLAILLGAAGMCVWTIRSMFRPLAQDAAVLRAIDIDSPAAELQASRFPSEIAPFVDAVNAALARLRNAYRLQQNFISDAAHQLRTPLAVLTARLEASTGPADGEALLRDVTRVNRIVEQLLKLTRLDAMQPDGWGEVDLVALARDLVGYMAPYIAKQGREIELDACPVPVAVKGDYHSLFDALQNLVENAAQASPAGGVIRVAVHASGEIDVMDRGCGLTESEKRRLFDRFWRGKKNTAPGSGLGLSIVRKIVDAHGGTVAVADRDGGGTVFTMKLLKAP